MRTIGGDQPKCAEKIPENRFEVSGATSLRALTVQKRCIRKIHVYYFATVQKDGRIWVQPLGGPRFARDVSVSRVVCEVLWEVGRTR